MIKYLIPIALLAQGCWPTRTCTVQPGQPLPIGSCVIGADTGTYGGPCMPGEWGASPSCNAGLTCVDATCYACGKAGEACCGDQKSIADGWCLPGEGTCGSEAGNEFFSCVGGTSSPPPGGCDPGQSPNFFVWTLDLVCTATWHGLCAANQSSAEMLVNELFPGVQHGPVGTDVNAVAPTPSYACAEGTTCTVSDGSMATMFSAYTHDQVVACEHNLDPDCSPWVDVPNDSCPM